MKDLTSRKEQILRAVVVEYVAYAEPVPSELIAQKYELGVKSATVRNEMAEITDLGLLEQPHTSAGRIPSDTGYRYYVDRLILHQPVGEATQQSVLDVTGEEQTLKELLTHTTRSISRLTQLLAAAEIIRDAGVLVRHTVITALGPDKALLVMILQNGLAENRFLELPSGASLDHIGQANEMLSQHAAGKTLGNLTKFRPAPTGNPITDQLLKRSAAAIKAMTKDLTKEHIITDGEEFILSQPEFQGNPEAMQAVLASLSDDDRLREALSGPPNASPAVKIGRENPNASLFPLAIIRQTFYVGDNEAGTLALIGPTRMDYDTTVPLLNFTARAISKTLTKLLG